MVFIGIVILLVSLTLSVVLNTQTLTQVQTNQYLMGTFLTPPFFTIGGMLLIILGKMHTEGENKPALTTD
jgi:hypothetical protein